VNLHQREFRPELAFLDKLAILEVDVWRSMFMSSYVARATVNLTDASADAVGLHLWSRSTLSNCSKAG
jgi:hypothetical protein